jgi:membrane protein YdbS with pleckstrin-like domain
MQTVDATEERPHPDLIVLWRLHALLLGLAAGAAAWLVAWPVWVELFGFEGRAGLGRSSLVGLATGTAVSLLLLWRTRLAARVYRWQHRPGEGVVVCKGAWWQREVWIPMTRLQHLDIKRGPLERWLGLATLELHTAGAHDHETRLPGLEPPRAKALRDALLTELQREGNGEQSGPP